ncbi:MAG: S8 family peptidase, partial [Candidatus Margulisbacteria bacterium]|nr:S8 family peptidase [Candidatus Margulisiibacteriota bacterium]
MRRQIFSVFLLLSFFLSGTVLAKANFAPGKVMVKFKPGKVFASSVQALHEKNKVYKIRKLYEKVLEIRPDWTHLEGQYVLEFPEGEDAQEIAAHYRADPNISEASVVTRVQAFAAVPNDPYFSSGAQYGLVNIEATRGWDRTTGSSNDLIAVLDTGINYNHVDLQGKINLADAWDFVNNDSDPWDDYVNAHGTTVAGVIAAATNNSIGVAGMNWNGKILPVKVLNNAGSGDMSDILEGIAWAQAKGADVINMSFGQYVHDVNLQARCQNAYDAGIVLVAAAGNGGGNWPTYPAWYDTVIAVSAVDRNDQRAVWTAIDPYTGRRQASNYGTWVDVAAPGNLIATTFSGNDYVDTSGTSLSSPFVAGLASLIRSTGPTLTVQQIKDRITSEADDIDALNPGFEGQLGKRINVYLALSSLLARITSPETNAYIRGIVPIIGTASGWTFSNYKVEAFQGSTFVSTIGASATSVDNAVLATWDTSLLNGEYTLKLSSYATGLTEEASVSVVVDNVTPEASLTAPASGGTVSGTVALVGTASDQNLYCYQLEYGTGAAPTEFLPISQAYVSVSAGVLGSWVTNGLSGLYTIRLSASDKAGATLSDTVLVTLANEALPPTKEAVAAAGLPVTYSYPNPFSLSVTSECTLNYTLLGNFDTKIYLFELSGKLVWQASYPSGENGGKAGANTPVWNAKDLTGATV